MKGQYAGSVRSLVKSMLYVVGAMFIIWGSLNFTSANFANPGTLTDAAIKYILGGFLLTIGKKF